MASRAVAASRAITTATPSPAKCTVSTASGGACGAFWSGVIGQALGSSPRRPRSRRCRPPTPGSAGLVGVDPGDPHAGERTTARCSMPGNGMLSVQRVRPVMRRASSLRVRDFPNSRWGWWVRRSSSWVSSATGAGVSVQGLPASSPARRSARRARCSGSRCTGRGCLDALADLVLVRSGLSPSRSTACMIIPGVQNPHCRAWHSLKAFWTGCSCPSRARPSIVVTSPPSACTASTAHDFTLCPFRCTVQAPQLLVSQPTTVPVLPSRSRR